jgi:hypothetical protein
VKKAIDRPLILTSTKIHRSLSLSKYGDSVAAEKRKETNRHVVKATATELKMNMVHPANHT